MEKIVELYKEKLMNIENEKDLINLHILIENKLCKKNRIDKNHTILFKGYSTILGYNKRIKKYSTAKNEIFPYGTAVLGICIIMIHKKDSNLALMEANLLCKHPQSLLVCHAIIKLFETSNIEEVQNIVQEDKELVRICKGPIKTNFNFLKDWARHAFVVVIASYMRWPITHLPQESLHIIYKLISSHFYFPLQH